MHTGYLFDLDGVVFDTESQYTLFWRAQLRRFHPDQPGLEQLIKGQTLTWIYEKYFSGPLEKERPEVTRALNDFECRMSFDFIPGFQAYLGRLKAEGKKTAVVTSSNRQKMSNVYRQHPQLPDMMDAIITADDMEKSKPDPDGYLRAARRLGLQPADCIGFEDSFNGLRSVRAAGMKVVGLATTNSAEAIAPLADIVVSDYKGLSTLL